MSNSLKAIFFLLVFATSVLAQPSAPITVKKSPGNSREFVLSGKLHFDKDCMLKLNQPLTIYNAFFKKRFITDNIDVCLEECETHDANWNGSRVKVSGYLTRVSEKPGRYRAVEFIIKKLDGQPQPLSGPLYSPYDELVRLSGTIRMEKCKDRKSVFFFPNKPINVGRGGEFSGPLFDLNALRLIGVDIRNGMQPGPVKVEGFINYGSDSDCTTYGLPMLVKKITGAKDGKGNKVGLREVLIQSEWKGRSDNAKDDLHNKMRESLYGIDDKAEKNQIPLIDNGDMDVAYIFVDGERTQKIKSIQTESNLRKAFDEFYGFK